jgi:hypothetical protein
MLKEALAKSKSDILEPNSKMQSILNLALRTTKENYCFESLNPGCKAFVRGLICPSLPHLCDAFGLGPKGGNWISDGNRISHGKSAISLEIQFL